VVPLPKPLPHDVFYVLAFQPVVSQEVVDDCCQCGPVILPVKQLIELRGSLLQIGEAFSFRWNQRCRVFPSGRQE